MHCIAAHPKRFSTWQSSISRGLRCGCRLHIPDHLRLTTLMASFHINITRENPESYIFLLSIQNNPNHQTISIFLCSFSLYQFPLWDSCISLVSQTYTHQYQTPPHSRLFSCNSFALASLSISLSAVTLFPSLTTSYSCSAMASGRGGYNRQQSGRGGYNRLQSGRGGYNAPNMRGGDDSGRGGYNAPLAGRGGYN